jgi:GNAT superfamily N-acetyltransferase
MIVREATASDAAGIASVHIKSWQATYKGKFPQGFLDKLDLAQRTDAWRHHFTTLEPSRETVLVGLIQTEIVGFTNIGPSRNEDAKVDEGEVRAIYLDPLFWGQGLGSELMSASLDTLSRFGYAEATLWVLDENYRARRFYEAGGWQPDDAFKSDERLGFSISEVRYRRRLQP